MIRGLTGTLLWTCLAGAVGVGLFFVKHEVKEFEGRLAGLKNEIQRTEEEIHVLKAEWTYLNDPARLRQLSERHLGMRPIAPTQIATLDDLPTVDGGSRVASNPVNQPVPAISRAAKADSGHRPAAKPPVARPTPQRPSATRDLAKDVPAPVVAPSHVLPPTAVPAAIAHRQAPPPVSSSRRVAIVASPSLSPDQFPLSGEGR